MKKQKRRIRLARQAILALDLPEETDGSVLKVTLYGHGRAVVENHKGVYEYTESAVALLGAEGVARISGSGLAIRDIDAQRLCVTGTITNISYE